MSVTSDVDSVKVYDYLTGLDTKFLANIPEDIQKDANDIWFPAYGAYIFQSAGDPMASDAHHAETLNAFDASDRIQQTLSSLRSAGYFTDEVLDGVGMYAMSCLAGRVHGRVTKLTMASLLKYTVMVLKIREHALDDYNVIVGKGKAAPDVNCDWLIEGDARMELFQENIPMRQLLTIAYVGSEMHLPLLRADREKVCPKEGTAERIRTLFESPRYRAYKAFVYDKSTKHCWNAVTWLKARAYKLVSSVSVSRVNDLLNAIDTYADSMRTSTTGSVLCSPSTVFAPKSVEGQRLITNLFKYHLPQVLDGDLEDDVGACVAGLDAFFANEGQVKPRGRKI